MWRSIISAWCRAGTILCCWRIGGVPERMGALRAGSVEATSSIAGDWPASGERRLSCAGRPGKRKRAVSILRAGRFAQLDQEPIRSWSKTLPGRRLKARRSFTSRPIKRSCVKSLGRNLRLAKPDRPRRRYQGLIGGIAATALSIHRGHELDAKADGAAWHQSPKRRRQKPKISRI